ncbi:MAG: heme/copper-type cytochrome/quinol oxidase subunit 4 [Verrucomicrobiales bacterium]
MIDVPAIELEVTTFVHDHAEPELDWNTVALVIVVLLIMVYCIASSLAVR